MSDIEEKAETNTQVFQQTGAGNVAVGVETLNDKTGIMLVIIKQMRSFI
ncbi:MAG: hypothetical protein ACLSE6_00635 [Alphaproteobacteria bacterium]